MAFTICGGHCHISLFDGSASESQKSFLKYRPHVSFRVFLFQVRGESRRSRAQAAASTLLCSGEQYMEHTFYTRRIAVFEKQ